MARPKSSRGFTLVELLVVITIIGMLVSLLLPAIQAARESGRRSVCQSNMRQAAMGLIQFSETKRGFPGYVNIIPKTVSGSTTYVRASWVVPILPALEENQRYQNWQNPGLQINSTTLVSQALGGNREAFVAPLSILVCPSNANPDLGDNPLSYVVNTGLAYSANDTSTTDSMGNAVPSGTTLIAEDVNGGVFFNHSKWDGTGSTTPVGFTGGKKVNADFLNTNDGTTHTLMVSENLQAVNWATDLVQNTNSQVPWTNDITVRGHTGIVWFLTGNLNNAGPPGSAVTSTATINLNAMGINDSAQQVTPGTYNLKYATGSPNTHGGLAFARPSANHSGGVNAAFCDGHMYYLNDEIEYHVYTQLMTPNQKAVNVTPTSTATTAQAANWIYVLNEADY